MAKFRSHFFHSGLNLWLLADMVAQQYKKITKCDRACKNRACEHMIFAYFLKLFRTHNFTPTCYGNEIFSA